LKKNVFAISIPGDRDSMFKNTLVSESLQGDATQHTDIDIFTAVRTSILQKNSPLLILRGLFFSFFSHTNVFLSTTVSNP
jgi:hypothetical protein